MYKNNRFTLLELMIVVAIIMILASMLLPALKNSREMAQGIKCKNQMKQIGQNMLYYVNDYNDYMPYCLNNALAYSYCYVSNLMPAKEYIGYDAYSARFKSSIYRCPSFVQNNNTYFYISYGYNLKFYFDGARKINSVRTPSQTLLLLEKGWEDSLTGNYPWYAASDYPATHLGTSLGKRHKGFANILYVDNHVADWKTVLPAANTAFWTGK